MATFKNLVKGQTSISIPRVVDAYSLIIRQRVCSAEIIGVLEVFQKVVAQGRVC